MAAPVDLQSAAIGAVPSTIAAVAAWYATWRKNRSDDRSAQAAMIKAAQDAATETVTTLRAEINALRDDARSDRLRISELEKALAEEKAARQDERHRLAHEATEAKAEALLARRRAEQLDLSCKEALGERRHLEQRIDSLVRVISAAGLELPPPPARATEPLLLGLPDL